MADSEEIRPNYYRVKVLDVDGKEFELECDELIEALGLDFPTGNVLKYLWRAGRKTKDRRTDLRKVVTYARKALRLDERRAKAQG